MSSPTPVHTAAQGYGNIYTPHAGSMVIQVQRELGLANRTIVLSPRKVRLLRFFTSRVGKGIAVVLGLSWIVLALLAMRVPLLTNRLQNLEHTAQRLDTLETTLSRLQYRYNQVHRLLGPSAVPAAIAPVTGQSATTSEPAYAATSDKPVAAVKAPGPKAAPTNPTPIRSSAPPATPAAAAPANRPDSVAVTKPAP